MELPRTATAVAAAALAVAAVGSARADLVPHTALYSAHLADAAERTRLVAAEGVMQYTFADACDAWTVETRVYLRLRYDELIGGELVESSWSFASTESKDGRRYRFNVRHGRDGDVLEKLSGTAERTPGKGGHAVFKEPDGREVALPAGTLFPTDHLVRLLDAAAEDRHRFSRPLFDGASLDNPYEVNAVIAGPVELPRKAGAPTSAPEGMRGAGRIFPRPAVRSRVALAMARAAGLADTPAWRTRLAFFPVGVPAPRAEPAVLPEFEIEADYRADGVAERILQDFGDFVLELEPVRIERLPPPEC